MSTYNAPLKDMQFAIAEFAGLDGITALPGCSEVNAELVEAVLTEAGKFAQGVLDPLNRSGDKQGALWRDGVVTAPAGFKDAYAQFAEAGWNSLGGSVDYGGQGLPHTIALPLQEMWNSANMAFCLCPMLTTGVQEALTHHGSCRTDQNLYAETGVRRVDRHDEPHGTPGRFRSVGGAHARNTRR